MQVQGHWGMGGMWWECEAPGKSGLIFDHIISWFQGGLQRTRDRHRAHNFTGEMNDIHDTSP
jgi:hypothetical protein